ncbi:MAG: hypothetical protein ACPG5U_08105 [Planktomarina sp.]
MADTKVLGPDEKTWPSTKEETGTFFEVEDHLPHSRFESWMGREFRILKDLGNVYHMGKIWIADDDPVTILSFDEVKAHLTRLNELVDMIYAFPDIIFDIARESECWSIECDIRIHGRFAQKWKRSDRRTTIKSPADHERDLYAPEHQDRYALEELKTKKADLERNYVKPSIPSDDIHAYFDSPFDQEFGNPSTFISAAGADKLRRFEENAFKEAKIALEYIKLLRPVLLHAIHTKSAVVVWNRDPDYEESLITGIHYQ